MGETLDQQDLLALARAAGIEIPAPYQAGVLTHLRVAAAMAQRLDAAPLSAEHLAAVFDLVALAEAGDD